MDQQPRRPAERPSSNAARALALALVLVGALGLVSACKGDDEKPADEEPAVALKIPESGELPGTKTDEIDEAAPPKRGPARKPGAPQLKTSADAKADGDAKAKPALVTARTSKRLNAHPAGPGARPKPGAHTKPGARPAPAHNPDRRPAKQPGADDGAAPGTAEVGPAGAAKAAAADAAKRDGAEAGDDDAAGEPAAVPPTKPTKRAPVRIAGRAPAGGTPVHTPDKTAPPLNVERFLPLATVRDMTSERRMMAQGPLAGIAPAPGYNSVYYGVPGKEGFGVAVQVWQDEDRRSSVERYRQMRRQYPNSEDVNLLAPAKAFYSSFGPIQTLTVTDTNKRLIVSVSCGEETCSQQVLLDLVKHTQRQL